MSTNRSWDISVVKLQIGNAVNATMGLALLNALDPARQWDTGYSTMETNLPYDTTYKVSCLSIFHEYLFAGWKFRAPVESSGASKRDGKSQLQCSMSDICAENKDKYLVQQSKAFSYNGLKCLQT